MTTMDMTDETARNMTERITRPNADETDGFKTARTTHFKTAGTRRFKTERIKRIKTEEDALEWLMSQAQEHIGIQLGPHKGSMVRARLGKRLRKLNCDCITYAQIVSNDQSEWRHFVDLITTNHTHWWREPDHYAHFAERVLIPMRDAMAPQLRVWCAGAASGEEPYSIAHTIITHLGKKPVMDVAILATDISERALERAREGIYPESRVEAMPPLDRTRAVDLIDTHARLYKVRDELRSMVHFARLNLLKEWPMRGPMDVIFCRNVMIYFDKETQQKLVERFTSLLRPGGILYLGHSESLTRVSHSLRADGASVYRKP